MTATTSHDYIALSAKKGDASRRSIPGFFDRDRASKTVLWVAETAGPGSTGPSQILAERARNPCLVGLGGRFAERGAKKVPIFGDFCLTLCSGMLKWAK